MLAHIVCQAGSSHEFEGAAHYFLAGPHLFPLIAAVVLAALIARVANQRKDDDHA